MGLIPGPDDVVIESPSRAGNTMSVRKVYKVDEFLHQFQLSSLKTHTSYTLYPLDKVTALYPRCNP